MNNQSFLIAELLIKKLRHDLSEQEALVLKAWAEADSKNQELMDSLLEKANSASDLDVFDAFDEEAAFQRLTAPARKKSFAFLGYAAAALVALATFSLLYFKNQQPEVKNDRFVAVSDNRHANDVMPAEVGAYIVRGDGEKVEIDQDIVLLNDGKISNKNGEVVLDEAKASVQNTLVVPAAHFFALSLNDGTKVWVNANSELQFPSQFAGAERVVKLKGEAYFEVAKDAKKPFIVESNGAKIKVLGTHFNVNSYTQQLRASLLEGRIAVSNGIEEKIIFPGQQARVLETKMMVSPANLTKDVAWKNNVFLFKADNIVQIAQQLKNWYDLEISFANDVSLTQTYTGEIKRDAKLSEVLKMLEYVSNLDFRINQNKLLILNKK